MVKFKDIGDVLASLDDCHTELDDLKNLLCLFDEVMWDEVKFLNHDEAWKVQNFKGRYEQLQSVLNIIRIRLYDVLEELEKAVTAGYEMRKAENTPT